MTETDIKQRIAELESQLAFQDDTVQTLNDIVTRQQLQLATLEREMKVILSQVQQLSEALNRPESEETPPPHY